MKKKKGKSVKKDAKMGRPVIDIDWDKLDEMCEDQCTEEEIASVLGCSPDTLSRRIKEKYDLTFADLFKVKRLPGFVSLRSSQFELAKKNPKMSIHLGIHYLGQKNSSELTLKGGLNISKELKEMDYSDLLKEAKKRGLTLPD